MLFDGTELVQELRAIEADSQLIKSFLRRIVVDAKKWILYADLFRIILCNWNGTMIRFFIFNEIEIHVVSNENGNSNSVIIDKLKSQLGI